MLKKHTHQEKGIIRYVRRRRSFRPLTRALTRKTVVVSIVLMAVGASFLVYSLNHNNLVRTHDIQQDQLVIYPNSTGSFQIDQPTNQTVYVNFTVQGQNTIQYKLYAYPARQVAFYSTEIRHYFMEETNLFPLNYTQPDNLTLVKTGVFSNGSNMVLKPTFDPLGQQYLLTVQSGDNISFDAQVIASTTFVLNEHSDLKTGVVGIVLTFSGIIILAVSLSRKQNI